MDAKHTPGPWMATVGNRGTLCVISTDAWICGELSNGNGELPGEAEANARIIAAAPDLLAALKLLATDVSDYEAWQRPCHALDAAVAAIAKAEGRS